MTQLPLQRTFLFMVFHVLFIPTLIAEEQPSDNKAKKDASWASLFDGKTLKGWKASENKDSCRVEDGASRYELVECEPMVKEAGEYIRECNRTDDLSTFIRKMRKSFVRLCESGN